MYMTCYYHGRNDRETRPLGPNGAPVCYQCVMGNPERELIAQEQMLLRNLEPEKVLGTVFTYRKEPVSA